ncbi:hypothetical protein GF324_03175, partial [bacterium]|nr:hypothetical protein [bacterium]
MSTEGRHIVMLMTRHNPKDGRVHHLEARTLRDAGYRVTIVAPGEE